jgi:hypothetical protein
LVLLQADPPLERHPKVHHSQFYQKDEFLQSRNDGIDFFLKEKQVTTGGCRFDGCGWFKGGDKLTFGMINLARYHHVNERYNFLSFEYDCQFEDDEVYFALNQPYTYSRLVNFIENIKKVPKAM